MMPKAPSPLQDLAPTGATRLRWLAFALCALPSQAMALSADDLTITLETVEGDIDDLLPVGIASCPGALATKMELTAKIKDPEIGKATQKFVFVSVDSTPNCDQTELETACNNIGTPVDGCTCVAWTTGFDTSSELTIAGTLGQMLPAGGVGVCSGDDETKYRFFLTAVSEVEKSGRPARTYKASDGGLAGLATGDAAPAGDAGEVEDGSPVTSAIPFELQIDLARPVTPAETYTLLQSDGAIKVDFPSNVDRDITRFNVCWVATGGSGSQQCETSDGTSSVEISVSDRLKLETPYDFSATAIDDASNEGQAVSIGNGAARDFLDLAEYYRQMHGPETGGCGIALGSRGVGATAALIALAAILSRRRRSKSCG